MIRLKRYVIASLVALAFMSCRQEKGESLARRYCASCHRFPEPSMLPKATWEQKVLPEMAFRMGLDIWQSQALDEAELTTILTALPAAPMVTDDEWKLITDYYVNTAPDSLAISHDKGYRSLTQFSADGILLQGEGTTMLSMIERDPATESLYVGTRSGWMYHLSESLTVADSFRLPSPASDIIFNANNSIVSCMGIMDPNDRPAGSIIQMAKGSADWKVLIDSLKRPVHMTLSDVDGDKKDDFIVSAFGNFTGGLHAFQNTGAGYVQHAIHSFPGTRKTVVEDLNHDGLPDIAALVTQGDEHIALFTNRGDFRFSYQVLLKFPAVYGSSYFELHDFNADGHRDILYTNGDNADYSPVLKPYHAVRIFTNDGRNHFSESWHHPMHGASMAKAVDFDYDGDLDIAAISFFPDFTHNPEHSFIYFENQSGKFVPYVTTMAAKGRWIAMETADIDEDGDEDIVLAALNFPTGVPQALVDTWDRDKVSLLVLSNNHK